MLVDFVPPFGLSQLVNSFDDLCKSSVRLPVHIDLPEAKYFTIKFEGAGWAPEI